MMPKKQRERAVRLRHIALLSKVCILDMYSSGQNSFRIIAWFSFLNNSYCTTGVLLKDNNKVSCLIALVTRTLDTGYFQICNVYVAGQNEIQVKMKFLCLLENKLKEI